MSDEQMRNHLNRFDRGLAGLKDLFEMGLAFEDGADALRARIKVLEGIINHALNDLTIDPPREPGVVKILEEALAASSDEEPEPAAPKPTDRRIRGVNDANH